MAKRRYYLNWMGPISMQWYRDRGLTKMVQETLTTNFHPTKKKGEIWEHEVITEKWSAGRIDVADGSPYGDEISVPVMLNSDWCNFGAWLRKVKTDDTWTLKQLVEQYEETNPKITWWNKDLDN